MEKNYTLIKMLKSPTSKRPRITNWKLCVLYQVDTKAALECPARSMRLTFGNGYESLTEHLMQFQSSK